jgi:hypothetical protein
MVALEKPKNKVIKWQSVIHPRMKDRLEEKMGVEPMIASAAK